MPEFKPGTAGSHDTTTAHFATQVTGNVTGEPIEVNQPVELRPDGRLYKASGTGIFVGLMLALFTGGEAGFGPVLLVGLLLGVLIGTLTTAIGYALSQGKRDFNSMRQTVATSYEVMSEHNVAARARELLAGRPEERAAQFE